MRAAQIAEAEERQQAAEAQAAVLRENVSVGRLQGEARDRDLRERAAQAAAAATERRAAAAAAPPPLIDAPLSFLVRTTWRIAISGILTARCSATHTSGWSLESHKLDRWCGHTEAAELVHTCMKGGCVPVIYRSHMLVQDG